MTASSSACLGCAVLLAVAACSGRGDTDDGLANLPTWTLSADPTPLLADDGTPATMFTRILTTRLPNGDLLAGDYGSRELRIFRDGKFLTTLSRTGDGPGELRELSRLALAHDTIFVLGSRLSGSAINSFTVEQGFIKRIRLVPPAGTPRFAPTGRLTTGEYLVEEGLGGLALREAPPMGVLIPDSVTIGVFQPGPEDSTGRYRPIGRFLRRQMIAYPVPDLPMPFNMTVHDLSPVTLWAASGALIWVLDEGSGFLRAFDGAGETVLADSLPVFALPFDAAALSRARATALEAATDQVGRGGVEARFDPALLPGTFPRFDQLVAGHEDAIWLRLFDLEPGPQRRYLVVDRTGKLVATVAVPTGFTIHQVGPDFLLGLRQDSDGVETILSYQLNRR